MLFSEFSNLTQLIFGDDTYHLNIKTKYQDNDQPDIINLDITIVKILIQNKYQAETLELIYNLQTRTFSANEKLKGFSFLLYNDLIKMLNETYLYTKGKKFNRVF